MRLSTIVATGGLGLSVAAFLGRLTQPFELLSQFRVQYIVLGLVLFTWSAVARERPTAIVAACMLGLNLGVVAVVASQVASQVAPASEAAGPRLAWANLYRKPEVLTTLASQTKGADIVALTEVPANGLVRIRAAFPGFQ